MEHTQWSVTAKLKPPQGGWGPTATLLVGDPKNPPPSDWPSKCTPTIHVPKREPFGDLRLPFLPQRTIYMRDRHQKNGCSGSFPGSSRFILVI